MKKRNMKRDTSDMSGGGMAAKLLKMQKACLILYQKYD